MWTRFKTFMNNKGGKEMGDKERSLNVTEEYFCALRTKSYIDFQSKAQLRVNLPSSPSSCYHMLNDILLQPSQESITSFLDSTILPKKSHLKSLILNYFDITAEASKICTDLLKSINEIQLNNNSIQQVLGTVNILPHEKLLSSVILTNPFSDIHKLDFKKIHTKYAMVLQDLKSKRKKVARKIKFIKCFNNASGVCLTAGCALFAIAAVVLAAHTLTALLMGPAILSLPLKPIKKKFVKFMFLKSGLLKKVRDQLDMAAKGTFIVDRNLDTMSRLVARLHDEIEHNSEMMQLCLDRKEDRFSWEVLKDIKKSEIGFKKKVEELEEHVYLCLVTINRATALVMNEIAVSYSVEEELVK